jgi:hypothetical protein
MEGFHHFLAKGSRDDWSFPIHDHVFYNVELAPERVVGCQRFRPCFPVLGVPRVNEVGEGLVEGGVGGGLLEL